MYSFRVGYSSGDITNLIGDIAKLKPTFFGSFPAFYNKIYNKIHENIESKPSILQSIVDQGIQTKILSFMKYGEMNNFFYDMLVFRVMKNVLGGNIRFMVSGGAPLSIEVKNFLTVVFSAPIIEAYGMTETAGLLTSTCYWDRKGGHVGGTLPCNRMHLRDVPELGLYTDDDFPTGEIYVKGNAVFKGYYKDPG